MPLKARKLLGDIDNSTGNFKLLLPHFVSEKENTDSVIIELSGMLHETRKPLLNSDSLVTQTYCSSDASSKL